MDKKYFPLRLKAARLQQGLSLDGLVKKAKLGLTRQSIYRYERDDVVPNDDVLAALASALGVGTDYFTGRLLTLDMPMLRSDDAAANAMAAGDGLLEARIVYWAERYLGMERKAGVGADFVNPLSGCSVAGLDSVAAMADVLRAAWNCGSGPLHNVLRLMERKGIRILDMALPDSVYGLSTWADGKYPLVVLDMRSGKTTVERLRFTACHELAHLLLSFADGVDKEKMCQKFASFFLFPRPTFLEEMGAPQRARLSLEEMIDLKDVYGVSVAAIVHEAWDLRVIGRAEYDRLYDDVIKKNRMETGWGGYPYKETIGRERRIMSNFKIQEEQP